MKKKVYMRPAMTVLEMKQTQIICTSTLLIYDEQYTTEEQW